ncbi:hypothetical protein [Burkholderia sp. B21-007]|uniref:hypothetical protein n=1 Tax=Burkholderia sp. B21-007 TaxID=2890407 RepID=UPI001E508960|nr:hypothetical protein [Burkholderia sp. B21-007]UEP32568.1 hypothetical protein LMA01_34635 [Burkholderia sp. B21-007]
MAELSQSHPQISSAGGERDRSTPLAPRTLELHPKRLAQLPNNPVADLRNQRRKWGKRGSGTAVLQPAGSPDRRDLSGIPVPIVPEWAKAAGDPAGTVAPQHAPESVSEPTIAGSPPAQAHTPRPSSTRQLSSSTESAMTRSEAAPSLPLSPAEHALSAARHPALRRVAANIGTAIAREGAITLATTYIREVCGHEVARWLEHSPQSTRIAVSGTILGATALLNALVFLKQRRDGRANTWTKFGQASNVLWLSGAGVAAATTGGFGDAAALLAKATVYPITRDMLNVFVRLGDNRDPGKTAPNRNAVLADAAIYCINQLVVNTLQGVGTSHSGTSAATASGSVAHATPSVLAFSGANAFGETMDALCYPALTAFFDKFDVAPTLMSGVREGMRAIGNLELTASLHLPFVANAGDHQPNGRRIGRASREDFADKAMGAMLGRQSLFVALFGLIGAISQVGPAAKLGPKDAALVTNVLAALAIAFMLPAFVGAASASPRRQRPTDDIEAGVTDRASDAT